jgi:protoheme IX farnesyltransferase
MALDSDVDAVMSRTAARPIPSGRVSREAATGFGVILSVGSVILLAFAANYVAAALLAATIAFYVLVYTLWLKRRTPQNIVIGGAAGAFPPVIAWLAVTGEVTMAPLLMFAVIFLWTPPHFWALALFRNEDYRGVGVPMLPVVSGERTTRRHIFGYALVLAPAPLLLAMSEAGRPVTLAAALLANAAFLWQAARVARRGARAARADGYRAEKRLFGVSIVYLFAIFAALIADAALGALLGPAGWPRWV